MATTISPQGASGQKYAFAVYPHGQAFDPVSAVYLLCRRLPHGSFEVLYVGETKSLEKRFVSGHDGYMRSIKKGMTHIAAMTVDCDANRLRIETDLRQGLKPSCNMQPVSQNAFRSFGAY